MSESAGKWVTEVLKNSIGAVTVFSQWHFEHWASTGRCSVTQRRKQTTFPSFFLHVVQEIPLDVAEFLPLCNTDFVLYVYFFNIKP